MIDKNNFKQVLQAFGFTENKNIFSKKISTLTGNIMSVNWNKSELIYPSAVKINDRTTCNFEHPENFVVFECVHRLLEKGYRPEHIELEKRWNLGHDAKSGKADICVYDEDGQNILFIIECKTAGQEYSKALKLLREDGGQLFSYWQQERSTKWIALYASDWKNGQITFRNDIINCTDDPNIIKIAEKDKSMLLYKNATSVPEYFVVWSETYGQKLWQELLFGEETQAYKIGIRPLRKKDLKDFDPDDKIVNKFEEILRHNNVSDKENAFNRLVALFICKLVDEITKNDNEIVDFQYKQGTDTYETLQDRLQWLHTKGMQDFMGEEIFYVRNDYAENLFKNFTSHKRAKAIEDLQKTIRNLKFYSNNDFSFKDVHNEELFLQNGKILVEVVQLFENHRIVYPSKHQFLGDLFEQLLNKGFKQSEGQFFTPIPITRFIWDSLPLITIPKVIDYACGSGHFLTEAVESINKRLKTDENNDWVKEYIFGIEKDYRLARVAKISLFMNGAGGGNIIFGDGLENHREKKIENNTFDILVANPPYSVSAFKSHLKLKNNTFDLLSRISNDGSEIETLFVERIAQLLKPKGIAAVILPSSILSNDSNSYIGAREILLKNFMLRAIVQFGSKTFGATGTNTVVLFLEKYNEPPKQSDLKQDSAEAIIGAEETAEWEDDEILEAYLRKIKVTKEWYQKFTTQSASFDGFTQCEYLNMHASRFQTLPRIIKLQESSTFKKLTAQEQSERLKQEFYNYAKPLEYEKILYFGLTYKQTTLIITAPSDNAEQKRFLGYDWSNRKGAEGIQIHTPGGMLYNEHDRNAMDTIAASIRNRFSAVATFSIDKDRQQYCALANLSDMIDFSRLSFNKAIKLTLDKKIEIKSKYPLVRLGEIAEVASGNSAPQEKRLFIDGKYPFFRTSDVGKVHLSKNLIEVADYLNDDGAERLKKYPKGTILMPKSGASTYLNHRAIMGVDGFVASHLATIIADNEKILTDFLYELLVLVKVQNIKVNSDYPSLNKSDIDNIKIPLPPLAIQQQIVAECEKVDEEYNTSRMSIEEYKKKIAQVFERLEVIANNGGGGGQAIKN
ncbi:MAG: N-6 DNA methylase [Wolinella sp.]